MFNRAKHISPHTAVRAFDAVDAYYICVLSRREDEKKNTHTTKVDIKTFKAKRRKKEEKKTDENKTGQIEPYSNTPYSIRVVYK